MRVYVFASLLSMLLALFFAQCGYAVAPLRGVALPLRARVLSYYLLPIAYDLLPVDQSEFIWACVQGVIDALKSPQSKRRWPE